MSKYLLFNNGIVSYEDEQGKMKIASEEESKKVYASNLPKKSKTGASLLAVRFNKEAQAIEGIYSDKRVLRKKLAYNSTSPQTEPINSVDKAKPSVEVPRSKKHSIPENKDVAKDRKDVRNEVKIRKDNYEKGKGGEDLHENIPRSKSNSGLKGSEKTSFEDETSNKATSKNPDKYVQELQENVKPTPAGDKMNHTAKLENKKECEEEKENRSEHKEKKSNNGNKKEEKNKTDSPNSCAEEDNVKEAVSELRKIQASYETLVNKHNKVINMYNELVDKFKEHEDTINTLRAENNESKLRMARINPAIECALLLKTLNPSEYPDTSDIVRKVEASLEIPDNAISNMISDLKKAVVSNIRKASTSESNGNGDQSMTNQGGITSALVIPRENQYKFASNSNKETMRDMFKWSVGTRGYSMEDYEEYNSTENKK